MRNGKMIELKNVSKVYKNHEVVKDVSVKFNGFV